MDEAAGRGPRARADPAAARRGRRACATCATSRRSSASSSRSAAAASSASTSTSTAKNSDRYLVNLVQGGLGLPDESLLPRREVRRDPREVRRLPRAGCSALAGHADAGGAAAHRAGVETRLAAGPLGARRDPRRPEDLQPDDPRRAARASARRSTGRRSSATSAAREETIAETCVRQPSYLEHLSTALDEVPIEDWRAWLAVRVVRAAAPYLPATFVETNFDFYGRTLSGTPELRDPLEARRRRWSRARSARRSAASTSPGTSRRASKAMMDELVANLLAAYRAVDRGPGLDERGDQAAGLRQARHVPPEDRLPRRSSATTPSSTFTPDDLLGNVARGQRVRDRPPAGQDRRAGRPRRVAHAAADRQRLLQPGHERDLLPGRRSCRSRSSRPTPSRPRTTAASAR